MTKALMLANELNNITSKIDVEFEETRKRLSQLDKAREDILHLIEGSNFNACDGYKLSLSLQLLSKKRRQAKLDLAELQVLKSNASSLNEVTNIIAKGVTKVNGKNNNTIERGIDGYKAKELKLDVSTIVAQVNKL